ncbi:sodium-dependent transporter [Herbivorax sp. ANBcel31]|uniref:sodium-dependent transporter n=1 Tax=Herbivorax sp. ANBcel31 TaxID=3069754 RepID=UPI0027AED8B9|nr:sodium-dependent transporter [Herbivorax sp. ANBcel31]MDQ2086263.1 sodium-dependent transporter [Herbivorax sp. ANBcel31]
MNENREKWGSRSGFILAMVGSAIGLGNIWRFPTVVGQSGGGAFILLYLLIIFGIGIPLMIGELAIGRRGKSNIVATFKKINPKGKWWITGVIGVTSGFVILSFYSVISGWVMAYIVKFISGEFNNLDTQEISHTYESLVSHPSVPLFWHGLFMVMVISIVMLGIHKGIEKTSKILMPILFAILLILVFRSITLEGAAEGIKWLFKPDWSLITIPTILSALGQVFFSLSLGMGTIITYGSYLNDSENIPYNSVIIAFSDVFIAIISAVVIIPAVFAYGVQPDVGMPLIFITLPLIFGALPLGNFFGTLFFILLLIASLTSGISLLQVVVAYFTETFKWSKKKASIITGFITFLMGIPSSLSTGLLENYTIFGEPILDFMDSLSSRILLPVGGLLTALFIGWVWKPKSTIEEMQKQDNKVPLGRQWSFVVKFILPVVLSYIIISGFF